MNSSRPAPIDSVDNPPGSPLALFAKKALIVATFCVASVLIVISVIDWYVEATIERVTDNIEAAIDRITQKFDNTTKIGGAEFWARVEHEIDRAADPQQGLSAEKQRKLLNELRAISVQWRPFLTEAYSIVTEHPKTTYDIDAPK